MLTPGRCVCTCAPGRVPHRSHRRSILPRVEKAVREIVGNDQIKTVLDNIGLPYSGMNMAIGDTATVGTMDGEMLISLNEDHTPTAAHMADLRRELPKRFPDCQFFFQAADIVNQVLNFGQPAPIDVRVVGSDPDKTYALAAKLAKDLGSVPGVVDSHVYQVPNVPGLKIIVRPQPCPASGHDPESKPPTVCW